MVEESNPTTRQRIVSACLVRLTRMRCWQLGEMPQPRVATGSEYAAYNEWSTRRRVCRVYKNRHRAAITPITFAESIKCHPLDRRFGYLVPGLAYHLAMRSRPRPAGALCLPLEVSMP